jgi:hypothetical protein
MRQKIDRVPRDAREALEGLPRYSLAVGGRDDHGSFVRLDDALHAMARLTEPVRKR